MAAVLQAAAALGPRIRVLVSHRGRGLWSVTAPSLRHRDASRPGV